MPDRRCSDGFPANFLAETHSRVASPRSLAKKPRRSGASADKSFPASRPTRGGERGSFARARRPIQPHEPRCPGSFASDFRRSAHRRRRRRCASHSRMASAGMRIGPVSPSPTRKWRSRPAGRDFGCCFRYSARCAAAVFTVERPLGLTDRHEPQLNFNVDSPSPPPRLERKMSYGTSASLIRLAPRLLSDWLQHELAAGDVARRGAVRGAPAGLKPRPRPVLQGFTSCRNAAAPAPPRRWRACRCPRDRN